MIKKHKEPKSDVRRFQVDVRTTNPNNSSQGVSRGGMMGRAKKRKLQRSIFKMLARAYSRGLRLPVKVTLTRVAPSVGLDPHDGLGAALKGCIDGIADGLGLKNDRDPQVKWILKQKRGEPLQYCVVVEIKER